ncbi:MAG TPA: Rad52/Rad22 family DNA repair protein [Chloroflexia bacterium]|nr:Rad52/Rad22 family DNA repair protein [Chloroflexia bacterium]
MSSADDFSADQELVPQDGATLALQGEKQRLFVQTLDEAQVDFLLQRTPRQEIKMRQGRGGLQFAYVEHGYVTERLNMVFGFNWDFEIIDKQILEDEVIVEAKLTVRTPKGQTIVKTQFGGADIKRHASGPKMGRPLSIADDYKAAGSDALKKCASLLGIGLDLYGRDRIDEDSPKPAEQPTPVHVPEPLKRDAANITPLNAPAAGSSTSSQIQEIGRLARQCGMPISELCATLGVSDLSELTEARSERVIKRLRQRASEASSGRAG